jgi:hypothetical protein
VIECGSLEYAHARVHARHGERLDAAAWRRIEVMRDFAPSLELARASALRPWLVGITADSSAPQIEATLRGHWRSLVDEVAGWMPAAWRQAVAWCVWLPDLALLQHLARGGESPPWVRDDDVWRELSVAPPPTRAAVLAAGPAGALASAWPTPHTLGRAWLGAWRLRLPQHAGDAGTTLEQLVHVLLDHARAFAVAAPSQGWSLRGALQTRLTQLLRRSALQPASVFVHVALCALDLERLRAELLRRVIFRNWKVA